MEERSLKPHLDDVDSKIAAGDMAAFEEAVLRIWHWIKASRSGNCNKILVTMRAFIVLKVKEFETMNINLDADDRCDQQAVRFKDQIMALSVCVKAHNKDLGDAFRLWVHQLEPICKKLSDETSSRQMCRAMTGLS